MNINQLKYVLEVAASSSMREASTKLYVSQPALSASIHDLEEELGILIFERNNKGISLTDEGRELLSYAKKAVQQYEMVDIILANFTVTDERTQKVDFALPYMNVSLGVVSPDSRVITDLSQLGANDEVIVISGTTAEDYLIKNYPNIAEKRKIAFLSASDHVSADSLDSEHMNEEGHRILASIIYDKLRETKMI